MQNFWFALQWQVNGLQFIHKSVENTVGALAARWSDVWVEWHLVYEWQWVALGLDVRKDDRELVVAHGHVRTFMSGK